MTFHFLGLLIPLDGFQFIFLSRDSENDPLKHSDLIFLRMGKSRFQGLESGSRLPFIEPPRGFREMNTNF